MKFNGVTIGDGQGSLTIDEFVNSNVQFIKTTNSTGDPAGWGNNLAILYGADRLIIENQFTSYAGGFLDSIETFEFDDATITFDKALGTLKWNDGTTNWNIINGSYGCWCPIGTAESDLMIGSDWDGLYQGWADNMNGGAGNDRMYGKGGNDKLLAAAGDDVIFGGSGADYLDGGADNDLLYGGTGNDSYVYNQGGTDVIDDHFEGAAGNDSGDNLTINTISGSMKFIHDSLTGDFRVEFSGSMLTVVDQFADSGNAIENFTVYGAGQKAVFASANLDNIINIMAAYDNGNAMSVSTFMASGALFGTNVIITPVPT